MTISIKNWKRFQTGEYQSDWIRLPCELVGDKDWIELSGDDAKFLIELLLTANENGEISPDPVPSARRTQQGLNNIKKWWREGKLEPVVMPDETNDIPRDRCDGKGKYLTEIVHPSGKKWSRVMNCWKCEVTGRLAVLKATSTAKLLIYPDTEKWYAWYNWFEKTNLFAVREMDMARDDKRPYPVETEWPPNYKQPRESNLDWEGKSVAEFIKQKTREPKGIVIDGYIDAAGIMMLDIETPDGSVLSNEPRTNVIFKT